MLHLVVPALLLTASAQDPEALLPEEAPVEQEEDAPEDPPAPRPAPEPAPAEEEPELSACSSKWDRPGKVEDGQRKRARPPVVGVRVVRGPAEEIDPSPALPVYLGNEFDVLLRRCEDAERLLAETDQSPEARLTLYLDGQPISGLPARVVAIGQPRVRFTLRHSADNADTLWSLGGMLMSPALSLTVGTADQAYVLPSEATVRIGRISAVGGIGFLGALILPALGFVGATRWRKVDAVASPGRKPFRLVEILRDRGQRADGQLASFSLARTQMAFWTVLITVGFVLVAMATWSLPAIPASLVALMGLGTGTLVGAAAIERTVGDNPEPPATTGRFLDDLLMDQGSYSLHRVQMLSWTFILGGYFVYQLLTRLLLPSFDETLLGLMGVSSLAYLGMKIPEQRRPDEEEAPAVEAAPAEEAPTVEEAPTEEESPPSGEGEAPAEEESPAMQPR